jgi:hypothetical protein
MQPTNSESGDPASSTAYSSSIAHAYSGWRWAWGRRLNGWRFDRRAQNRCGFDGRRNVRSALLADRTPPGRHTGHDRHGGRQPAPGQPVSLGDLQIIAAADVEAAVRSVCSDNRDLAAIVW